MAPSHILAANINKPDMKCKDEEAGRKKVNFIIFLPKNRVKLSAVSFFCEQVYQN